MGHGREESHSGHIDEWVSPWASGADTHRGLYNMSWSYPNREARGLGCLCTWAPRSWMSAASRRPCTAHLSSVWTELTPGATGAPEAESHLPAMLAWGAGLNQSSKGWRVCGVSTRTADTRAVTGHRLRRLENGGLGGWVTASLWGRRLGRVSVLGLRLSRGRGQDP